MRNKWYVVLKTVFGPLLHLWNRPEITGLEHVPDEGAAMIASSHESVADSFFFPLMCERQLTFPAKQEYFTAPGISGTAQRWFFNAAGQIPIDRSSSDAAGSTLEAAKLVFEREDLLGIYPEGTRSPDGRIFRGHTGMARIAMETGVPVVPVAMINSRKANPIGTKLLRPAKVRMRVGEAIDPHAWAKERGLEPGAWETARPFTDYVMNILSELSGKPYVDYYAKDVKASLAAGDGYPEGTEPGGHLEVLP